MSPIPQNNCNLNYTIMDHYKKDVDSVKNTLEAVERDLKIIGFENPIIYPLSAYAGYLGKMVLYGEKLSEDEQDDIDFVKRKLKRNDFSYEYCLC